MIDPLLAAITNADHKDVGGVQIDIVRAGNMRVGRVVYPPGFRWSTHMSFDFTAPAVVVLEAGHDAWVVGKEPAVLIQFDAEAETARRFGLPDEHRHA